MSEYYGGDYLYTVLNADAGVISSLGTTSNHPVFNARMVPMDRTERKTINMYRLDPYDASIEYFQSKWSIDCRGDTETDSHAIADAVTTALNRVHTLTTGIMYFGTVSILSTIPPANDTDQYNTSVQILIRRK
jgi:hypothetical protein